MYGGAMGELEDALPGLERTLGALEGEPQPLAGGITNRNYRARFGGEEYVLRRHGSGTELLGIDRRAELLANQAAARLEIAPDVSATFEGGLVTRFVVCVPLEAGELVERVGEVAAALRRFHEGAPPLPVRFWVPDLLSAYGELVRERGGSLPDGYGRASEAAARIAAAIPRRELVPTHNDLLPGNIIRADHDGRIMIVDWEYAGMGDPWFDLGNLSVNNGFDERADERLLEAYLGRAASDAERATLALMRVMSDAREAAWGMAQTVLSSLDFDFEGYAGRHFERLREAVEGAEFEEWLDAASA
jgi:thiamine kinase-like enzyme